MFKLARTTSSRMTLVKCEDCAFFSYSSTAQELGKIVSFEDVRKLLKEHTRESGHIGTIFSEQTESYRLR